MGDGLSGQVPEGGVWLTLVAAEGAETESWKYNMYQLGTCGADLGEVLNGICGLHKN